MEGEEAAPTFGDEGDAAEAAAAAETAPALIAVHPSQDSVAVAVGPELRVFDLVGGHEVTPADEGGGRHAQAIRAVSYGANGSCFVSAGDDKLVKVWETRSWRCLGTVCAEKRVSAVAVSQDGKFVVFADKFGVVWVLSLRFDVVNGGNWVVGKPVPLLGHYCSIITCLQFSPDGRFIASSDRDHKIRVSCFPNNALDGAHEIQSFCLVHTDYVSCVCFVSNESCVEGLLVSGSGDSTVRLWDYASGCLLSTCDVGAAALLDMSAGDQEPFPAVTDMSAASDGSVIAVAVQDLRGVVLLGCDLVARALTVAKIVSMEVPFIPTCIGMGLAAEYLWLVTGASNLPSSPDSVVVRVKVISGLLKGNEVDPIVLEDDAVPGGQKLLEKLQGSLSSKDDSSLATAAEAVKAAMHNLMVKKHYSAERREFRKRGRNDRKIKQ